MVCGKSCNQLIFNKFYLRKHQFKFDYYQQVTLPSGITDLGLFQKIGIHKWWCHQYKIFLECQYGIIGDIIWSKYPHYEVEKRWVWSFIFLFFMPSFFLIWFLWVSIVLVARFRNSAISFVVLPRLTRFVICISVGVSLKPIFFGKFGSPYKTMQVRKIS